MSRLLVKGNWYSKLAVSALYEGEYERIILQQACFIFPYHHCVPFKTLVYDGHDGARADLALIEKNYREWWVVEVELGSHPFEGHVLGQVRVLSRALYDEQLVDALRKQMPPLESSRVLNMLKGKQPRVMIVVNEPKPDWYQPLKAYNAILTVVEIYRSINNEHIFRVSGEQPGEPLNIISECYLDPLLCNLLVVESPAGIPASSQNKMWLRYDNEIMECERIEAQDMVWLSPIGPNPFSPKTKYQLLRSEEGSLVIRPIA